jgi:predicted transcriptional regulator
MVTKAQMIEAIQALPDDASYQDLLRELDRLDFIDAVERGLADIEAGRFITQAEVERRVTEWFK